MISTNQAQRLIGGGGNVTDSDGTKIGGIGQVFLDDSTGEPAWVTTKTGMFGGAESFVPLQEARLDGDDVAVPYGKDKVKDAPQIKDSDGHLEPDEERRLYEYYGLGWDSNATTTTQPSNGTTDNDSMSVQPAGVDTSGPETDDAMTRSEERLDVGTERAETGKARLRKFVVTEQETHTVPVRKERAVLETEPITDANRGDAVAGGDLTSEDHEVTLTEERAVVSKETVPVERVRMGTETVSSEETVTEEVRKEKLEAEGDVSPEATQRR